MSIFKNNKQTKLTTTLIQDLNWMVKRVSVDTLPEYQQNSDTLQFRDNIKLYERPLRNVLVFGFSRLGLH